MHFLKGARYGETLALRSLPLSSKRSGYRAALKCDARCEYDRRKPMVPRHTSIECDAGFLDFALPAESERSHSRFPHGTRQTPDTIIRYTPPSRL